MSSKVEEPDFITTIKELMRLTREGMLDWSVDHSSNSFSGSSAGPFQERLPTYTAEYDNLKFTIKDASPNPLQALISDSSPREQGYITPGSKYKLVIKDREDSSTISSPPMKPIKDLVSTIKKKPKRDKLSDINQKLSEID
jgi:hypothetical protein